MPSSNVDDTVVIFTDASANSISCVLTQLMEPLTPSADGDRSRRLHVVGVWSKVIGDHWSNYPIWLLELVALYETTRKYRWFLINREFWAISDSQTLVNWASLQAVPKDLARKILALQKFNYRILFIESRLNPADCFSRLKPGPAPAGTYPRFLKNRIYNSKSEPVPWESLFSPRKAKEAQDFFHRHRHQTLSTPIDPAEAETADFEDDEDDIFTRPDGIIELETPVMGEEEV